MSNRYSYRIQWSNEDSAFVGRVLEFPSLAVHGASRQDVLANLDEVLKATLSWMEEEGEDIPRPISETEYRGAISLRVSPDLHRELVARAAESQLSLNQLIVNLLERNIYVNTVTSSVSELRKVLEDMRTLRQPAGWTQWEYLTRFQIAVTRQRDEMIDNSTNVRPFVARDESLEGLTADVAG